MKRLYLFFTLFVLLWLAQHATVYIHEWTHRTVAWLTGYKNSPFAIHYGTKWFTLWDINQAVPNEQLLADGKPGVMAAIAIAPILLEVLLCLIGTFSFHANFSDYSDVSDFLYATGLSPWAVAIPGTLFALWGIYRMLSREAPRAFSRLGIDTKLGQWTFLSTHILLFFGYYGAVGFMEPYPIDHKLSLISWMLIPFVFLYCWRKRT